MSASRNDNKIAWYENQGGGNFGAQQTITTSAADASSVYAAYLDGDNDADVLSSSQDDHKIAWYENQGSGNFGAQQTITTNAVDAMDVHAADLNNNDHMDVLSASLELSRIAWYKNDGSGSFSSAQVITTSSQGATSVYAAEITNDNDLDVLSAAEYGDKISWYESSGPNSISPLTESEGKVYPNPTDGSLKFAMESDMQNVTISSITGEKVKQIKNLDTKQKTVDLSDLVEGIYLARIQTGKDILTVRILKK